jgi:hypothetical protein
VVPSAPGGGTDIIGRLLAKAFTSALGQSFYVENKPGAGNLIGIEAVANAPADGYTLLFVPSPLVLNPILYKKVNYDPIKDFAPISLAATAPNIFVIHPSVKANNLRDWIALGKKDASALNYASAGVGTSPHMSMELFNYMAGIQALHVPYKGTSPAVTDLLGGQGQWHVLKRAYCHAAHSIWQSSRAGCVGEQTLGHPARCAHRDGSGCAQLCLFAMVWLGGASWHTVRNYSNPQCRDGQGFAKQRDQRKAGV